MPDSYGTYEQVQTNILARVARTLPSWPTEESFGGKRKSTGNGRRRRRMLIVLGLFAFTLVSFLGLGWQLWREAESATLSWEDSLTAALFGLLALGAFTQTKTLGRAIAPRLGIGRRKRVGDRVAIPEVLPLAQVAAADLPAVPELTSFNARTRAGHAARERVAVIVLLVLGAAGIVSLSAVVAVGLYFQGPWAWTAWIGFAFFALAAFAYAQFVRVSRETGWRASPLRLVRRAAFDSLRVWTGASLGIQLAIGGLATATVVGAGVGPLVVPEDAPQHIYVYDAVGGSFYRVSADVGTAQLVVHLQSSSGVSAIAELPARMTAPDGTRFPRGSLLTVILPPRTETGRLVLVDPKTKSWVLLGELERPLLDAGLSFGPEGKLFVLEASGELSMLEPLTGNISPIGNIGLPAAALEYNSDSGRLVTVSGTTFYSIDPLTAEAERGATIDDLSGGDVCAVAAVSPNNVIVVERVSGKLYSVNTSTGETLGTIGEQALPGTPCGIAVTRR